MLTSKQQRFVKELMSGKNQTEAYRAAYEVNNMNNNSVRREASRLMMNPNITTTVRRLQHQADCAVLDAHIATRHEVLNTLTQCMYNAKTGDSVRIRAAELLGKHYGLFNEEGQHEPKQKSSEQIRNELRQLLLKVVSDRENTQL